MQHGSTIFVKKMLFLFLGSLFHTSANGGEVQKLGASMSVQGQAGVVQHGLADNHAGES